LVLLLANSPAQTISHKLINTSAEPSIAKGKSTSIAPHTPSSQSKLRNINTSSSNITAEQNNIIDLTGLEDRETEDEELRRAIAASLETSSVNKGSSAQATMSFGPSERKPDDNWAMTVVPSNNVSSFLWKGIFADEKNWDRRIRYRGIRQKTRRSMLRSLLL
jgi:hypothetical protein